MKLTREDCRTRVLVIYTGGTLGMVSSDPGNAASPLRPGTPEEVATAVASATPGLGESRGIYWELRAIPGQRPYDSSDINADHWLRIASFLESEYWNWDGFVVLHGTDTMAYTASGLSFLLENLAKPVVLTGSQLPLLDERSDARANLANALYIAGYQASRLPCVPEVVICFGHLLLRGNRSRKVSTADLNGFESPNYPPLGLLREHIEISHHLVRRRPDPEQQPFRVLKQLSTHVMDITLFPGMRPEHLAALLHSPNLKGLIIRTFGAGNIMNEPQILDELAGAARRGVAILNTTQCLRGRVEMGQYENSSALLDIGVAAGSDMTPEAGLAKMMWALASPCEDVRQRLQTNQRGEQSTDLMDIVLVRDAAFDVRMNCTYDPVIQTADLERALLRLAGLEFEQPGAYDLHVTIGDVTAATLRGVAGMAPLTLVADVTSPVAAGGNVLTLQSVTGTAFRCQEARLSLLTRAVDS